MSEQGPPKALGPVFLVIRSSSALAATTFLAFAGVSRISRCNLLDGGMKRVAKQLGITLVESS